MEVRCLEVKGVNHETLKAIAKISIEEWGLVINDVKLLKKNESVWVTFPNKVYESEGQKKYFPLIQFADKKLEESIKNSIKESILKEFELAKQIKEGNKDTSMHSFDGLV